MVPAQEYAQLFHHAAFLCHANHQLAAVAAAVQHSTDSTEQSGLPEQCTLSAPTVVLPLGHALQAGAVVRAPPRDVVPGKHTLQTCNTC